MVWKVKSQNSSLQKKMGTRGRPYNFRNGDVKMSIYYEDEVALEEPNRMVTRTKNKRNRRCLKASISDLTFGTIFPPCNNLMKNVPSDERNEKDLVASIVDKKAIPIPEWETISDTEYNNLYPEVVKNPKRFITTTDYEESSKGSSSDDDVDEAGKIGKQGGRVLKDRNLKVEFAKKICTDAATPALKISPGPLEKEKCLVEVTLRKLDPRKVPEIMGLTHDQNNNPIDIYV